MKTTLKNLAGMMFFCMATTCLHSQGYIVPSGVTSEYIGSQFNLYVIQNPNNGDYSGFALNFQTVNSFLYNPILDGGVRTFFVSFNSPISEQTISANSYPELTFPNIYTIANGSPFYLGLYAGPTPPIPQNGIYNDPLFGWARLVNNQGAIQMLDSALAYRSQGIFAGTQNLIPEPSVISLTILLAVTSAVLRRRLW